MKIFINLLSFCETFILTEGDKYLRMSHYIERDLESIPSTVEIHIQYSDFGELDLRNLMYARKVFSVVVCQ